MTQLIVDPAALAHFAEDKMQKINLFESARLFCDVYCLEPGQEQRPHDHPDNDKLYYALSGVAHVILGDSETPLLPGQLAVAPAGVRHGLINRSDENATLLVVMAPSPNA